MCEWHSPFHDTYAFPKITEQWNPASGQPVDKVSEYPVETRCSHLLPDRFQCNSHPLSPRVLNQDLQDFED